MDDSDLLIGALVVGGLYLATRDSSSSSTPQQSAPQASNAGCNGVTIFGVCVPQSVVQQGANAVSAFIASISAGNGGGANYSEDDVEDALADIGA